MRTGSNSFRTGVVGCSSWHIAISAWHHTVRTVKMYRSGPKSRLEPDRAYISGVGHVGRIPKIETRPALAVVFLGFFFCIQPLGFLRQYIMSNEIACHGCHLHISNLPVTARFQVSKNESKTQISITQHHSD